MNMRMKDVTYRKCCEYSPYSEKADRYGNKYFWRADCHGETIAYGDTKAECMESARAFIQMHKER